MTRSLSGTCSSPVSEVDDLVEEEGPAGRASEPRRDELVPVGEEGVALRAGEEALAPNVLQVDAAHLATLEPFSAAVVRNSFRKSLCFASFPMVSSISASAEHRSSTHIYEAPSGSLTQTRRLLLPISVGLG